MYRTEGWECFPQAEPAIRFGNDGLAPSLDAIALFKGITFPVKPMSFFRWRGESIKALGNAIVPQVAFQTFKAIATMEERLNKMS